MEQNNNEKYEYKVFLSSGFDRIMSEKRDLFRAELVSSFNIISGRMGINTYLVDFEYGIPSGTSKNDVIKICLSNVKVSNLFICILSERYGQEMDIFSLPEDLQQVALISKHAILVKKISVLELEILTAISNHIPSIFFVQQGSEKEVALQQLISQLRDRECDIRYFESYMELADLAVNTFKSHIGIREDSSFSSDIGRKQLFARKLRYYCEMYSAVECIDHYVKGEDTRILLIEGEKGAGKTTAIAYWARENEQNPDLKIISWFDELGPTNYTGMLTHLLDQTGIDSSSCMFPEDAVNLLHEQLRSVKEKRYVFIIDGADTIEDNEDPLGWLVSQLSPSVKMIITATNPLKLLKSSRFIQAMTITPVSTARLMQKIYYLEGKQYEYPGVKDLLNKVFKVSNPRQITLAIQQFLREVKYVSSTSELIAQQWNAEQIFAYLQQMNSEWVIFKKQCQYLKGFNFIEQLDSSIMLIACSEKGISMNELAKLTGGGSHFIHQFYFSLYCNEDLYYFPKEIRDAVLNSMTQSEQKASRDKLISFFRKKGDDRANIELYYQFTSNSNAKDLYQLLESLHRWRIIQGNTTLPYIRKDYISERSWTNLFNHWEREIKNAREEYDEREIYTAYSLALEIGRFSTAAKFVRALIDQANPCDYRSLASYYQIMSDLYDELDDMKSLEYIQKALYNMALAEDEIRPQNQVDTYLMAAEIFSHFAFVRDADALERKKETIALVEQWLQAAIVITENDWNMNAYFRSLTYHGAAYSSYNICCYENAYKYIQEAIACETSDLKTRSDIFFLKGQICVALYEKDKSQIRFLEEAEKAVNMCDVIEKSHPELRGIDDRKKTMSKLCSLWADVLCERGEKEREEGRDSNTTFCKVIDYARKAIALDEENQPEDIYRSYYNAGLHCLNVCQCTDLDYYQEGKKYARIAMKYALKRNSAQSRDDLIDIFILLSNLQRFKNHKLSSSFFNVVWCLLGAKSAKH